MLSGDTRRKIEDIVSGAILEGSKDHCTAIRNYLCTRFTTSTVVKKDFESNAIIKKKQTDIIATYCDENNLWLRQAPDEALYLTRGGEAKIYLHPDSRNVIKLNDAIYYATWLEFLNSILLHNLIFPNTYYRLTGFIKQDDALYAVLEQIFILAGAQAGLDEIKRFLEFNEFKNTRRNDYANSRLGLILEDMHDENVIASGETLFFIDSVFYTIAPTP